MYLHTAHHRKPEVYPTEDLNIRSDVGGSSCEESSVGLNSTPRVFHTLAWTPTVRRCPLTNEFVGRTVYRKACGVVFVRPYLQIPKLLWGVRLRVGEAVDSAVFGAGGLEPAHPRLWAYIEWVGAISESPT